LHHIRWIVSAAVFLFAITTAATAARAAGGSVASLVWTAPGDNGMTGTAKRYDIRRSTAPITLVNFSLADTVGGAPQPARAGSIQTCFVVLPDVSKTYYFGIRTVDAVGNVSGLSNIVTINLLRASAPRTRMPDGADFGMPWPNPARSSTTFQLQAPEIVRGSVQVFDAAGRHVRSVFQGEMPPGTQQLQWDLRDDEGRAAPGGVYFVRVQIGAYARTRQLVVVR
jgi:hypothetical protein